MTNENLSALSGEFLDDVVELCRKWQAKHGHPVSLICSTAIHITKKIPEDVADVGYEEGDDEIHMPYIATREMESDTVHKKNFFPAHARGVLRDLDEYRDGSEDDY